MAVTKHESIAENTLRSVKILQVIIECKVDYGNTFRLNKTCSSLLLCWSQKGIKSTSLRELTAKC